MDRQLIVNLVPELELLIGKQLAVAVLSPQRKRNRFQLALRRFLAVIAGAPRVRREPPTLCHSHQNNPG
jgi:predicted ATPase